MKSFKSPEVGIIPAAGKGTRFLPSTKATPKEMHPLLNKPLIHHCLKELADAGVKKAIIISHPEKKTLENYFDDHGDLKKIVENKPALVKELESIENLPSVSFVYQREQLGLAHAVLCAKEAIQEQDFYLLLPDEIFLPESKEQNPCVELKESFEKHGQSVISLLKVDKSEVHKYGVADLETTADNQFKIKDLVEKPKTEEAPSQFILPGRYLFKNDILEKIERTPKRNGEVQLTDSIVLQSQETGVFALETKCKRFDGGSVLGFLKANIYAGLKDAEIAKDLKAFLQKLNLH